MSGTTTTRIPTPQRHRSFHTGLDCLVRSLVYMQPPCPEMTLSSSYQPHRVFSLSLSFLSCAPSSTLPSTRVWDRCPRRVSRSPVSRHTPMRNRCLKYAFLISPTSLILLVSSVSLSPSLLGRHITPTAAAKLHS